MPSTMSDLPVPHLFMGVATGILALMTASAVVEARGSTTSSTLAFLALVTLSIRAARSRRPGGGRPLLGLGAGLLAGLAGANSLVSVQSLPPDGPHWVYLPVLFATLGTLLALTSPHDRTDAQRRDDATASATPPARSMGES